MLLYELRLLQVHTLQSSSHPPENLKLFAPPEIVTTNYRLSPFTHFVPADNGYVGILNSLNLGVVGVPSAVADKLSSLKSRPTDISTLRTIAGSALLQTLRRQRLLLPVGSRQLDDLVIAQEHLNHASIGILYLLLSDACNIQCNYCYFEGAIPPGYQFSRMPFDIAQRGLDLFAKIIPTSLSKGLEEPQIILYGGEPFLNWPVMERVLEYVASRTSEGILPPSTSVTINTNGTLISPEIARELRRFSFVTVAVSIDGPREVHDRCRVKGRGKGTFEAADRGIRYLQENDVQVGLCCTLADHNLDHAEEILLWLRENYGVASVGFNLLLQAPNTPRLPHAYAERAAEKLISCFKLAREHGIYEDRIMRKVKSFVDGEIYYYDCGGCGQQLVVSPDGHVGVCQAYCGTRRNFVPLTEDLDPDSHPLWMEWRRRSPIGIEKCRDCIALGNCGGGCAFSAEIQGGSIWELDESFCHFSKEVVRFLVRDLLHQMMEKHKAV